MDNLPTIKFTPAYSGGRLRMDPRQWPLPTVFDIDGIEERPQEVPIVRDHDQNKKVGQTTSINYDDGKIVAEGVVLNYGIDPDADKIVELSKRGAKLQASVATCLIDGADVERVEPGRTATANGRTFEGPVEIVRKWRLKEISVVTLGADDDGTSVVIGNAALGKEEEEPAFYAPRGANQQEKNMKKSFNWQNLFKGLGFAPNVAKSAAARVGKAADGDLTEEEVIDAIEEAKKAANEDDDGTDDPEKAALSAFAEEMGVNADELNEDALKVLQAAFARFGKAAEEGTEDKSAACEDPPPEDPNKTSASAKAESGKTTAPRTGAANWSRTKYPVDNLGRFVETVDSSRRPTAARIAEASLFASNGARTETLKGLGYSDAEIDEATRKENRNLTPLALMFRAGAASYGDCSVDRITDELRKAQTRLRLIEVGIAPPRVAQAAGQLSTIDIPNVLANVMYKSMLSGLNMIDDPTDQIARVVTARDFRPQYFVDLLASGDMKRAKANGELEKLKVSDTSYSVQAETRGYEIGITYQQIVDDDMQALQDLPKIMGRKAAIRKQRAFFETFTKASSLPGITGNPVLNLAGLDAGIGKLETAVDGDNDPLGLKGKFLIVPPALKGTAYSLTMASTLIEGATGSPTGLTIVPNEKKYAEQLNVITSPFLGSGGPFSSSWGDGKWMLLCDPVDTPLMLLSYYQGQKEPTVKSVYGDAEIDGVTIKLWWSFGISVANKKACAVSTGAGS